MDNFNFNQVVLRQDLQNFQNAFDYVKKNTLALPGLR